ncbi:MAG: CAP domain-containing protein [Rhodobacteraceae bacterium]|nr:CAP domain-containing protein [Paracoccaceae bacterium]
MNRRTVLLMGGIAVALSACGIGATQPKIGADGRPLPRVYKINGATADKIPFRVLDSINTLRAAKGAAPLALNAELNAAALTHSRDMSVQNRPWHFGSDGSSPLLRVQRVGYSGKFLGELISETYETEMETLAAWMAQPDTRDVVLDPMARNLGFAWYQEKAGKIWWTLLTGA